MDIFSTYLSCHYIYDQHILDLFLCINKVVHFNKVYLIERKIYNIFGIDPIINTIVVLKNRYINFLIYAAWKGVRCIANRKFRFMGCEEVTPRSHLQRNRLL